MNYLFMLLELVLTVLNAWMYVDRGKHWWSAATAIFCFCGFIVIAVVEFMRLRKKYL